MEVILNIKNVSKVFDPKEGDVIISNGKDWYVTTKEDLLKDAYKILKNCKDELSGLKAENENFKKDVAVQIKAMSDLIQQLYKNQEEK